MTRVERAGKASQEVTLKCGKTHTTKHSSVGVLNAFRDSFCETISIFCANFFFSIVVKYLLPCQLMIFYIFQACLSTTSTERTYKLVAFSWGLSVWARRAIVMVKKKDRDNFSSCCISVKLQHMLGLNWNMDGQQRDGATLPPPRLINALMTFNIGGKLWFLKDFVVL